MRGLMGGSIVAALGLGAIPPSHKWERMIDHAQGKVTHPLLRND